MSLMEKAQAVVDATPMPVNYAVAFGTLAMSYLQPAVAVLTGLWVGLQIFLAVEKRWGWQWLTRFFRKDK